VFEVFEVFEAFDPVDELVVLLPGEYAPLE
jgi:hypothetical protein